MAFPIQIVIVSIKSEKYQSDFKAMHSNLDRLPATKSSYIGFKVAFSSHHIPANTFFYLQLKPSFQSLILNATNNVLNKFVSESNVNFCLKPK